MSAFCSAIQCTAQAVSILGFLFVGIGGNSQMGCAGTSFSQTTSTGAIVAKPSVHKPTRVPLDPSKELVELSHVLNLWLLLRGVARHK